MIKTIIKRVNKAYTSKISYISEDVFDVQEYSNNKNREEFSCTIKSKCNGVSNDVKELKEVF